MSICQERCNAIVFDGRRGDAPACPAVCTDELLVRHLFTRGERDRGLQRDLRIDALEGGCLRGRLKVAAVKDPLDFVEAVFHAAEGLVHCRFGKHAHDLPQGIRIDTNMVTVDQAAEIILSGLRFPEY